MGRRRVSRSMREVVETVADRDDAEGEVRSRSEHLAAAEWIRPAEHLEALAEGDALPGEPGVEEDGVGFVEHERLQDDRARHEVHVRRPVLGPVQAPDERVGLRATGAGRFGQLGRPDRSERDAHADDQVVLGHLNVHALTVPIARAGLRSGRLRVSFL